MSYKRIILNILRNKLLQTILFLLLLFVAFNLNWLTNSVSRASFPGRFPRPESRRFDDEPVKAEKNSYRENDYLNKISADRLNKLFDILKEKEAIYQDVLENFDFLSFRNLLNNQKISTDYKDYIRLKDNNVVATEYFIEYLKTKSHIQTRRNDLNRNYSAHHELSKVF